MSSFVRGVFEDLRRRRLLPVAGVLLLALVAVPVLMLKKAEPVPPAASAPGVSANASVSGLPSPQQALNTDKPLVTLAVLDQPSDLDSFEPKNPFKPIDQVSTEGAGSAPAPAATEPGPSLSPPTPAGGSPGGSPVGGSPVGGSPPGGGPTGGSPPVSPPSDQVRPPSRRGEPGKPRRLTYAVDLAIRGPKGVRRYRGLPKLSLLPSQDNPLFVFLGVEDAGTKAVFLVDAKLKSVGDSEGTCTPSPDQCATLALAPGELHTLANDSGQRWTIQVSEVRQIAVAKAAAAARAAQKRRARKATAQVGDKPAPRFLPPIITDLFTGGRS